MAVFDSADLMLKKEDNNGVTGMNERLEVGRKVGSSGTLDLMLENLLKQENSFEAFSVCLHYLTFVCF